MVTRAELREEALADTAFFARHVLDYDYTKNEETGEHVRPGGVLLEGPHRQMCDLMDGPSRAWHLEAPRGSFKSTLLTTFAMRKVIQNPNIRVLYGMETYSEALKKLGSIREAFGREKVVDLFGDLRTREWGRTGFTVAGRTTTMAEPSFSAFGVDKNVTGGHFDIIILDDLVTWNNVRTQEGVQKVLDCFRMVHPLLDPGGILAVVGTRYLDGDLYGYILEELGGEFEILILDAGVTVEQEGESIELVGEPRFDHLTKTFLAKQLAKMGSTDFFSQYLNICLGADRQLFRRDQFRTAVWDSHMEDMAAYILTDTATSEKEEGCHSVALLVVLDAADRSYLADAVVGHLQPEFFVQEVLDMQERWSEKLSIRGITMESIGMNRVFRSMFEAEAGVRQIKINLIPVPRGGNSSSKRQRIQGVQGRFERGDVLVLDTFPRTFKDLGRTKELWHPTAHRQKDQQLPDGELVMQFVRFPVYSKNDIADAFADVDARDNKGKRICRGLPRDHRGRRARDRIPVVTRAINRGGRTVYVDMEQRHAMANQKRQEWADRARRASSPRRRGA